jgi:CheY-like chemotaxis protein
VTADPLFVPFAAAAHGRGRLGLAAVAGIVRSHRGALVVASEREGKSRLQVLLPCPPAPPLGTARRLTPLPPGGAAFRGSGTVLVVDDEEMVREVARIALCQAGFEVLTAADGAEGVALVRARGARIVAVILDLTMPRLDGRAAFAQIRALRAELPVLIISGYSHEEANERISVAGIAGFVQKPFAPADLIAALRTALDPAVRQPAAPPAAALAEAAPGPPTRD